MGLTIARGGRFHPSSVSLVLSAAESCCMSTDFFDIALSLASSGDGDDAAWVLATGQTLLDVQEKGSQQGFRGFRDAVGWHP